MTDLTLNQNARLTDALERDLLRNAMDSQQNAQPKALLKHAGSSIVHTVRAVGDFIGGVADYVAEVNDAMNRARAASANYTGSQW